MGTHADVSELAGYQSKCAQDSLHCSLDAVRINAITTPCSVLNPVCIAAGRLNPAAEACNRMQWMQLKLVEQNACAWMSANGSRKGEPQERIKAQLLKVCEAHELSMVTWPLHGALSYSMSRACSSRALVSRFIHTLPQLSVSTAGLLDGYVNMCMKTVVSSCLACSYCPIRCSACSCTPCSRLLLMYTNLQTTQNTLHVLIPQLGLNALLRQDWSKRCNVPFVVLQTGAMSVDVRRITVGLLVGQQLNRWLRQIANGEALCTQLELKLSPGVCPVPEPAAEPETDLDLDPLGSSQHKNQQQQHATGSASCVYDSVVEGDHWLAAAATGDHPGMSLTDEVEQKLQRLLLSSSNASSSTGASEQAAACHPSMHPCGHTSSSNEMAVAGEHHSCGQTMRASASNERSEESSAYTSGQRTAAGGHSTEPSAALQQSSAHNARHPDSTPTSLAVQHALVNLVAQSKALSMQIDLTMHKQQQAASMPVADTSSRMQ